MARGIRFRIEEQWLKSDDRRYNSGILPFVPARYGKLQWGDELCFKVGAKIFVMLGLDNPRLCFKMHTGDFLRN